MKIMKILGALVAVIVILFIIVVNFSAVESRFECPGNLSSTDGSHPLTIYLKLDEYRWWVGLWSDSDASINIEIPNVYVDYFGNVKKVGDQYEIYDSLNRIKGNFSTLSKALAINIPLKLNTDFFDGTCRKTDN